MQWVGDYCEPSYSNLKTFIEYYSEWVLYLSKNWSGWVVFSLTEPAEPVACGAIWTIDFMYNYQGPSSDAEFIEGIANITSILTPTSANT